MAYTYAGQFGPYLIIDSTGRPLPGGQPVTIQVEATRAPAVLYANRNQSAVLSSVVTDASGQLSFYAAPGRYVVSVPGALPMTCEVYADPAEPVASITSAGQGVFSKGITTQTKAGSFVDGDVTSAVDGTIGVNTSTNEIEYRASGVWNSTQSRVVNVMKSGVKGDNVADDTAAYQSVLNTYAGVRPIWSPAATYKLSNHLYLPQGLRWQGDSVFGYDATILSWGSVSSGLVSYQANTSRYPVAFDGLTIWQSNASNMGAGIDMQNTWHEIGENITVGDAGGHGRWLVGIRIGGTLHNDLERCHVALSGPALAGVWYSAVGADVNHIKGCAIQVNNATAPIANVVVDGAFGLEIEQTEGVGKSTVPFLRLCNAQLTHILGGSDFEGTLGIVVSNVASTLSASRADAGCVISGGTNVADVLVNDIDLGKTVTGGSFPGGTRVTTVNPGVGFTTNNPGTNGVATLTLAFSNNGVNGTLLIEASQPLPLLLQSSGGSSLRRLVSIGNLGGGNAVGAVGMFQALNLCDNFLSIHDTPPNLGTLTDGTTAAVSHRYLPVSGPAVWPLFAKAGAIGDGDFPTAPPDGTQGVNTTTNKLMYRSGGAWFSTA